MEFPFHLYHLKGVGFCEVSELVLDAFWAYRSFEFMAVIMVWTRYFCLAGKTAWKYFQNCSKLELVANGIEFSNSMLAERVDNRFYHILKMVYSYILAYPIYVICIVYTSELIESLFLFAYRRDASIRIWCFAFAITTLETEISIMHSVINGVANTLTEHPVRIHYFYFYLCIFHRESIAFGNGSIVPTNLNVIQSFCRANKIQFRKS